jgi:hypothetical protein
LNLKSGRKLPLFRRSQMTAFSTSRHLLD